MLAGCPPGVFPIGPEANEEQQYFQHILSQTGEVFDVFDIHPYGSPYMIPAIVDSIRATMQAYGYEKPIVVGEYNGPLPFEYPEAFPALADVMQSGATKPWHSLTSAQFTKGVLSEPPAREAMKRLYEKMDELPPTLQMFMVDCPDDIEATRQRLNARDIVVRNLLALSCDIRRTVCWQIGPDVPEQPDKYEFLRLMFLKFNLLDYDGDQLKTRYPGADAFAELAARLAGAESVRRVELAEQPDVYLFEVTRSEKTLLYVAWLPQKDPFGDVPAPQTIEYNGRTIEVSVEPSYMQ